MNTFALSLTSPALERSGVGELAPFEGTAFPTTGFDPDRGLRFPLAGEAGLVFLSHGKISDQQGSLRIAFSLDPNDRGGQLLESWGGHLRLVAEVDGKHLDVRLSAYGSRLRLLGVCPRQRRLVLALDWDHRTGFAMSVAEEGAGVLNRTACNTTWHAYGQSAIPLSIGGRLESLWPGARRWQNLFTGCIAGVSLDSEPAVAPGVPRLSVGAGETAPGAVPASCTVLELHAPALQDSPLRFDSIPDREDNLRQCQVLHPELAAAYQGAGNAFEGLMNVGRWVANLWPHTEYWPWPREIFEERGDRLLANIKAGRTMGMCGGYAHTLEEALWALGVPARRVQVGNHSSLEAYDHEHDKWMCLEADTLMGIAGCWTDPDGLPYGIGELIELVEADRREPGTLARRLRHVDLGAPNPVGAEQARSPLAVARECYVLMGIAKRKDYGDPTPPRWYYHAAPAMRVATPNTWAAPETQTLVDDWRDLYWSCDRLAVDARWRPDGSALTLGIQPVQAQFFAGCEARIDEAPPVRAGTEFVWTLHAGINRLSLAATNRLGARGHAWKMTVFRKA